MMFSGFPCVKSLDSFIARVQGIAAGSEPRPRPTSPRSASHSPHDCKRPLCGNKTGQSPPSRARLVGAWADSIPFR